MNSKKATAEEEKAAFDDDMILEIVLRLPLKFAMRCTLLNRNLYGLISQRKKALISSAYPNIEGSILCRYDNTVTRITPKSSEIFIRTITIPIPKRYDSENPMLLDSCNGVLLLNFLEQRRVCVFNPVTGGIMLVSPLIKLKLREVTIALAVDLDADTIFQYKLVVAEALSHSEEETLWRFTVLVPSGGTSWLIKSPVELITRGEPCNPTKFVYVHGCVYYWDDEPNHNIIMFNVEKENARSIDWPILLTENSAIISGTSYGSLLSVYTLDDNEIEIHSYDQVNDEWQLKHKITHTVSSPSVLFCNGQRLCVSDKPPFWSRLRDVPDGLLMYDILSDKWEKISSKDFKFHITDPNDYFSFAPTLAKVSDKYLNDPEFEFAKVYVRGLQRLMMQEAQDMENTI